jgi:hypothetical protein
MDPAMIEKMQKAKHDKHEPKWLKQFAATVNV